MRGAPERALRGIQLDKMQDRVIKVMRVKRPGSDKMHRVQELKPTPGPETL